MQALRARIETEWPDSDANGAPNLGFAGMMRTWLRTGSRGFVVDPRRRLGKHGGARKMLAADGVNGSDRHGAWQGLVSALQRHTVHGELAQLSKDDRNILSLAYLSGHTNSEIAAMLQISVRTVSRRLSVALARLEDSMRKAGVWMVTLLLLALAAYERLSQYVRNNRWPSAVAMVAAGAATSVAVVFVVAPPSVPGVTAVSGPSTIHRVHLLPQGQVLPSAVVDLNQPLSQAIDDATTGKGKDALTKDAPTPIVTSTRVCHGNPTSAPAPTPVGPRGTGHKEPPVTTPAPGGCGHLNK